MPTQVFLYVGDLGGLTRAIGHSSGLWRDVIQTMTSQGPPTRWEPLGMLDMVTQMAVHVRIVLPGFVSRDLTKKCDRLSKT